MESKHGKNKHQHEENVIKGKMKLLYYKKSKWLHDTLNILIYIYIAKNIIIIGRPFLVILVVKNHIKLERQLLHKIFSQILSL